ncbi:MAG: hypothetical protein MI810_19925 [Flavobacteriales bacterium]|nr:hypothetical protein [Flavobacteriales bacterium]
MVKNSHINYPLASKVSLFFFFIVALAGTLLRSNVFISIPLKYEHLVHAHSHLAFQGWIYTIMTLFLTHFFLKKESYQRGRYSLQFYLTIIIIIGILISFSLQGYGLYSIIFSTLFQFLNYWFIFRFFKDTKKLKKASKINIPLLFIKTGMWLGILSTLVPFGIGVLSAKGLQGSEIYQSFVYTFLHLQYNGWFLFVALGLFYKLLESKSIQYHQKRAFNFYRLFTIAVIPAISLSFLGMSFSNYVAPIAYLSAILLLASLLYFIPSIWRSLKEFLTQKNKWIHLLMLVFLVSFVLKISLQSCSVLPFCKAYAFQNKPIILAYLHLSLIGVITFFFIALMNELKWLGNNGINKTGNIFLTLGFISTESLLITSGLGLYNNQLLLLIGSAAMAVGIGCLLISPQTKTEIQ